MSVMIDRAIDALIEKRIEMRMKTYNERIYRKLQEQEEGRHEHQRRHRPSDYFLYHIKEDK